MRTLCEDSLSQFIESPNAPLRSMLLFVIPLLCLPDGGKMDFLQRLGIHAEGSDTAGNLVRNREKSVRNHRNLARNQKPGP